MIDELAGVVGISPDTPGLTLRTLLVMHRGRMRADWSQTAVLLATLHNAHRMGMDTVDAKGRNRPGKHPKPWQAAEFMPEALRTPRNKAIELVPITVLKVFLPPDDPIREEWVAETRAGGEVEVPVPSP